MPTITFKVTVQEAAQIRRMAAKEDRTVSELIRRRLMPTMGSTDRTRGYRVENSRRTGLPVMHSPAGAPTVSSEQIRALLADFP